MVGRIVPQSQSIIECMARYWLRRAGFHVESQVNIPGMGHLDLMVDGRLGIETDGAGFHMDRASFEEDRRRWNVTTRLGIPTLVVSYPLLLNRPEEFIAMVRDALNRLSAAAYTGHALAGLRCRPQGSCPVVHSAPLDMSTRSPPGPPGHVPRLRRRMDIVAICPLAAKARGGHVQSGRAGRAGRGRACPCENRGVGLGHVPGAAGEGMSTGSGVRWAQWRTGMSTGGVRGARGAAGRAELPWRPPPAPAESRRRTGRVRTVQPPSVRATSWPSASVRPPSIRYRTTTRVPGSAAARNCWGEGSGRLTSSY